MSRLASVVALVALVGCVEASQESTSATAPAPLIGVDGSTDTADRACNIILRSLARNSDGAGGYETNGDSWVWTGTLDVAAPALVDGSTPHVLYHWGSDPAWYEGTVTESSGGPGGYARYIVRLTHDLVGPGMSSTAITTANIQVVPYLALATGGRLFDHNRNPGDLDNYSMTYPTFAVELDDAVCGIPASGEHANLIFASDFTQHREGVITAGGSISVDYDISRLQTCHDEQGGHALYSITAHVLWMPENVEVDASVLEGAATFSVPTDGAQSVSIWFETVNVTGCHAWDSNYGANYSFDVARPPQWVGNATNLLTRDSDDPCAGGTPASSGFTFDTWARERAVKTNLCFEVYQPGMTDHDDPDLWQKLDVELYWRGSTTAPYTVTPVSFDRRTGNNARYAFDWRAVDPFREFNCPDVPTGPDPSGMYIQAQYDYYIYVNGYELRPEPGAGFAGIFQDYPTNPWRDANCGDGVN